MTRSLILKLKLPFSRACWTALSSYTSPSVA